MPILLHHSNERMISKLTLKKGKSFKIGRSEGNDLVLNDPSVSGFHAEIDTEGDFFYLTDQQSQKGTFINNQLIISRKLKHQDRISIGNQTLTFAYGKGEPPAPFDEEDEPDKQKTIAIDTPQHRAKLVKSMARLTRKKKERRESLAAISFLSQSRQPVDLQKESISIGSSPKSDIRIRGLLVGKVAAVIKKKDEKYYLVPVGGLARVALNFETIKYPTLLKEFDVIKIGANEMQFHFRTVVVSETASPSADEGSFRGDSSDMGESGPSSPV